MRRLMLLALSLAILSPPLWSLDDPKSKSEAEAAKSQTPMELEALKAEFEKARAEYRKTRTDIQNGLEDLITDAKNKGKTQEELQELLRNELRKMQAKEPNTASFVSRFLELAEKNPKDPVAPAALSWVISNGGSPFQVKKALDTIQEDHIQSDKIAAACQGLARARGSDAEPFLRAVLEKNKHPEVLGHACFALAMQVNSQISIAESLRKAETAARIGRLETRYGKEYIQKLKGVDPTKLEQECVSLLERVANEFADVKTRRGTLGESAKTELFGIRNLAIGKVVPEIVGEDTDGKPMKLSDYRGKVVLLDFWGHW